MAESHVNDLYPSLTRLRYRSPCNKSVAVAKAWRCGDRGGVAEAASPGPKPHRVRQGDVAGNRRAGGVSLGKRHRSYGGVDSGYAGAKDGSVRLTVAES